VTDRDVDAIVDELYGADLENFTRLRNEAVKELRGAGEREAADEVRALTKPTVPAWVINQLSRHRRKQVDELLDAGHRLREGQGALLQGGPEGRFSEARAHHAAIVKGLVREAEKLLRERKRPTSGSTLERVATTLRAGSVSDEGRELLARGRLTRDVAPAGFEALAPLAPSQPARPKRRRTGDGEARRQKVHRLEQESADARDEERRLAQEARAAEKEADEARRRLERAAAKAAELEQRLERLKSESS
jgi:hypothetical protein